MSATRQMRRGMTLIELLVAMAIIAILGALVAVGLRSWIGTQARRNTEATIATVYEALQKHWKVVVDEARAEKLDGWRNASSISGFPTDVFDWSKSASGVEDLERARVIAIKLRLMEAFPVNF